jgi:hypothetical protein
MTTPRNFSDPIRAAQAVFRRLPRTPEGTVDGQFDWYEEGVCPEHGPNVYFDDCVWAQAFKIEIDFLRRDKQGVTQAT